MEGWKTKVGAVLIALTGILAAAGPVLPVELAAYAEWLKFAQAILAAAGAAFMGVGIAHKIEKASVAGGPIIENKEVCITCGK
jgi:hypothetical protein